MNVKELVNDLRDLIEYDKKECTSLLKEENATKLVDLAKKIISLSTYKDKKYFSNISNFDFFLVSVNASNIDNYSFQETLELAKKVEKEINSWTYASTIDILIDSINSEEKSFDILKKLGLPYEFYNYELDQMFALMSQILKFKEDMIKCNNINIQTASLFHVKSHKVKPFNKNDLIDLLFKKYQLNSFINNLTEYVKKLEINIKTNAEILNRKIRIDNEVLEFINREEYKTFTDIKEEWYRHLTPNIVNDLLLLLNNNLNIIFNKEKEKNKKLKGKIERSPFVKYLYTKGINPEVIDKNLLQIFETKSLSNSWFSKVKINLDFLLDIGFDISDILNNYYEFLTNLNLDMINKLNDLIKSGILNRTTIINNPEILTTKYNLLITNYNILSSIIDYKNQYYEDKVLLVNTNDLKDRITVLKEYDLTINNYIFLLCNYDYLYIYDLVLEHEIQKDLFISICSSSNPLNTIKRILICKMLDIDYKENEYTLKSSCLEENRFICLDSDLDDFFTETSNLIYEPLKGQKITNIKNHSLINYLDKNSLYDHDTYMIGSTLISKPKLLRNLEYVVDNNKDINNYLLPALISNSILEEKEIFEIMEFTTSKRKKTI